VSTSPIARPPTVRAQDCGKKSGTVPKLRASKSGRWRALVLVGVHALVALHVAHWIARGTTLSPLEPSEAMELTKHDLVNAGAVFFGLTILSTLVLGRWFCGWACHVVALQDLCLWLLKRAGIRPRPLRSRWLALVPAAAALYMFLWPLAYRLWVGATVGPYRAQLTKGDFWATFPPWPVALATFAVCGFVIVYFLGAKGFCTYGCPYGAIFGLADRLAVGRIRVTDACEGCGHCTATCTSNVIVHEEVRTHGMVVDPGCMKCLDCVSVCPKGALYFGFGRPSLGLRAAQRMKRWMPRAEELVLAAAFVLAFLAWRGLYGVIPFLLALGIAACLAFLCGELVRLARRRDHSALGRVLRREGRLTASGLVFVLGTTALLLSSLHGGAIQWQARRAGQAFEALRARREAFLLDPAQQLVGAEREQAEAGLASARFVRRHGLLAMPEVELELAWFELFNGSPLGFVEGLRDAAARLPDPSGVHYDLARFHEARNAPEDAAAALEAALAARASAPVFDRLARLHFERGRPAESLAVFERAVAAFPESADLRFNEAVVLGMLGRNEEAIGAFRKVLELAPGRRDARENLIGLLEGSGRAEEARALAAELGGG
jgi:tetratricopeptide (TPR) repeat protein/NAD-dependent dihydropyrimidine dehydrogenase PreA subunit